MLDHLTGGRLEIGTAPGIPNEMAVVGLSVDEARARHDEAAEIIDKALLDPVDHASRQVLEFRQSAADAASGSAAASAEMGDGGQRIVGAQGGAPRRQYLHRFHPQTKVIEIFDAYRDEAAKIGRQVGPGRSLPPPPGGDARTIRRRSPDAAMRFREFIKFDPRVDLPGQPAVLDFAVAHAFSIGEEEFIVGGAGRRRRTDHRAMPQRRRRAFRRFVRPHGAAGADGRLLPRFRRRERFRSLRSAAL